MFILSFHSFYNIGDYFKTQDVLYINPQCFILFVWQCVSSDDQTVGQNDAKLTEVKISYCTSSMILKTVKARMMLSLAVQHLM